MWLKLDGIIGWADYPEQSIQWNDARGYEPYPNGGEKTYGGTSVLFRKETFNAPYDDLFAAIAAELAQGRYLVVSLRPPPVGSAFWHGYLVTHTEGDDFVVFTKNGVQTQRDLLKNRLTGEKVDCLFMSKVPSASGNAEGPTPSESDVHS